MSSDKRALLALSEKLQEARNPISPYSFGRKQPIPTDISRYISPVQFQRMATDIRMWREAIEEAELAYNPIRVRMNRMYIDTIEQPYMKSLIARYKELNLKRDYVVYKSKRDGSKEVSKVLSQQLQEQSWFQDYVEYTLDAILHGYSLIELGDIVQDSFPNITFTRRQNIRPDGIQNSGMPVLTNMVYSIDGIHIKDGDPLVAMFNHWIPTKSNIGVSKCGYGLLYNLSLLEIHLRHVLEWNMDYIQNYGTPITVGSTSKQGTERQNFEEFLALSGANRWMLLDKQSGDSVDYEMVENAGTAWKCYDNMETRLEDTAAQLILGHTDAMKSTPGKLGGMQAANKDGFNESLVEQAMNAKQVMTGDFISRKINEVAAPKFRAIGEYVGSRLIKNLIPAGYRFSLLNDKEENEIARRINAKRTVVSTYVKQFADAGLKVDAKEIGEIAELNLTDAPINVKENKNQNTENDETRNG